MTDSGERIDRVGMLAGALLLVAALAVAMNVRQFDRLPDFGTIDDIQERKLAFFEYLSPLVQAENTRIQFQRERLLELIEREQAGESLGLADRQWLARLAAEYELEWPGEDRGLTLAELERRVDVVPVMLALVQAATESAWGQSRFARKGNNLFGQWCYSPGCGLVPAGRVAGARHEVAAFGSVRESVRRYINNLNTHSSYAPVRQIRAQKRGRGEPLHALDLVDGLVRYSERREAYVEEVKSVIRINRPLIEEVVERSP